MMESCGQLKVNDTPTIIFTNPATNDVPVTEAGVLDLEPVESAGEGGGL